MDLKKRYSMLSYWIWGDDDEDDGDYGANHVPLEKRFHRLRNRVRNSLSNDPADGLNDLALWRFIRAWQDEDAAYTAIQKYRKWRRSYQVDRISADDPDIIAEEKTGKARLLPSRDVKGRPVLVVSARKHDAYARDLDRVTRYLVYKLEEACKMCDESVIDNLCIVFDLKDFAMANMDYQFVKNLIWLLSKYYPERLGVCLIINAPMIFYGCWAVIRVWMNDVTASKVTFISNDKQLAEYLNPEDIPRD